MKGKSGKRKGNEPVVTIISCELRKIQEDVKQAKEIEWI